MTELEELKNHIEALEKRVEASDKKIALLEETLSTLGKFKASKEMGEYIERQQNAIRMADMLSSFSDETIDMTVQKASVANIQKQQESINKQIAEAVKKSKINQIQDNGNSLSYLKYESNGTGITITGCTAFDPVDIIIPKIIDGKPVSAIGKGAFKNSKIKSIVLSSYIKSIEDYAFEDCKNLKSVLNLNCNVGNSAFEGCIQLSEIEFGNETKSIGNEAFRDCKQLKNIIFGESVNSIGELAFWGCSCSEINLEATQITVLSRSCFNGCDIRNISFPKTLRTIEFEALCQAKPLKIVIPEYINEVDLSFISNGMVAFLGMNTLITFLDYTEISTKKNRIVYCLSGSKVQEYCIKEKIPCRPLSEFPIECVINDETTDTSFPLNTDYESSISDAILDLSLVLRAIIRKKNID